MPDEEWEGGTVPWHIHICTDVIRTCRDGVIDDIEDRDGLATAAFIVYPGEGSESLTLGLLSPLLTEPPEKRDYVRDTDIWRHWYWQGFCKTQYASTISEEHFLFCHRMAIDLLDEAKRIGFEVTVHDEGQYWETRDADLLLAEVRRSNVMIAHLAGALHDAIAPEHSVQAEIFAHPELEHLEMEQVEPSTGGNGSDS
ncbi:MAG: hypothetical protein ABIT20_13650 [Gemmatimonadaceae bacterium]